MGFLNWILQVLDGLIFLGVRRVIHCDLAARNILLDAGLNAKICDFGMSHQITSQHYAYSVSPHVCRFFSAGLKFTGAGG